MEHKTLQEVTGLLQSEVNDLYNSEKFSGEFDYLFERWLDEKKYEEWTPYRERIIQLLKNEGYTNIISISKTFELKFYSKKFTNVIISMKRTLENLTCKFYLSEGTYVEPVKSLEDSVEPSKELVKQSQKPQVSSLKGRPTAKAIEIAEDIAKLDRKDQQKLYHTILRIDKSFSAQNARMVKKSIDTLKNLPGKFNYICLDLDDLRYEVANKDFSIVAKNKSCGTWKKIAENPNSKVYIF